MSIEDEELDLFDVGEDDGGEEPTAELDSPEDSDPTPVQEDGEPEGDSPEPVAEAEAPAPPAEGEKSPTAEKQDEPDGEGEKEQPTPEGVKGEGEEVSPKPLSQQEAYEQAVAAVSKSWAVDDAAREKFDEDPLGYVHDMMARVQVSATQQALYLATKAFPVISQQNARDAEQRTKAEGMLYGRWPKLNDEKFKAAIVREARDVHSKNPNLPLAERVDLVGARLYLANQFEPEKREEQPAGTPVPKPALTPSSSGGTGIGAPKPQQTQVESFHEELLLDGE